MARYLVMVNGKYMVSVDADSACAAEHKILDKVYYGMQTALAFDSESVKTETFAGCAMSCDTISYDRLAGMSGDYLDTLKTVKAAEAEISEYERRIADLHNQIAELEKLHEKAEFRRINAEADMKDMQKKLGMQERMGIYINWQEI